MLSIPNPTGWPTLLDTIKRQPINTYTETHHPAGHWQPNKKNIAPSLKLFQYAPNSGKSCYCFSPIFQRYQTGAASSKQDAGFTEAATRVIPLSAPRLNDVSAATTKPYVLREELNKRHTAVKAVPRVQSKWGVLRTFDPPPTGLAEREIDPASQVAQVSAGEEDDTLGACDTDNVDSQRDVQPEDAMERVFASAAPEDSFEALVEQGEAALDFLSAKDDQPAAVIEIPDPAKLEIERNITAQCTSSMEDAPDSPEESPPSPYIPNLSDSEETDPNIKGLLHFKKWWQFRDVGVSVNGVLVTGTPIQLQKRTLRVVNDQYSYFIPMKNVDFIRTPDGLEMSYLEFEGEPMHDGWYD